MCDLNANVVLDKYFGELEQRDEFSGVVLITNGQSKLYSAAYGYASRARKVGNTLEPDSTRLRLPSCSRRSQHCN